jgi:hypothetical protein
MLITLALIAWLGVQDAAQPPAPVVLNAGLGGCSAEFTVTGADGQPAYAAVIRTRIKYGFMSMKRMDLELSTGSDGKGKFQGLPAKGKAIEYTLLKGPEKGSVTHDLSAQCNATFAVALKQ